jgi:hypothetical protein
LSIFVFIPFIIGKDEAVLLRLGNWAPVYEAGIILWVIFGLGYLFMIISIITGIALEKYQRIIVVFHFYLYLIFPFMLTKY